MENNGSKVGKRWVWPGKKGKKMLSNVGKVPFRRDSKLRRKENRRDGVKKRLNSRSRGDRCKREEFYLVERSSLR